MRTIDNITNTLSRRKLSFNSLKNNELYKGISSNIEYCGIIGHTYSRGKDVIKMYPDFGLCIAKYTPEQGAKFTFVENEDFTVYSVYGPPTYTITYKGVSTLDFTGTEFIGFRDFQRKVMIKKINDTSMQLVMFMASSDKYLQPVPFNTIALILSFEVVK